MDSLYYCNFILQCAMKRVIFLRNYRYSQINPFEKIFLSKHLHTAEEVSHLHNFFEFAFIYKGKGTQTINGQSFGVYAGDILLMGCGSVHSFIPDDEMGLINCIFEPDFINEKLEGCKSILQICQFDPFQSFNVKNIDLPVPLYGKVLTEIESVLEKMLDEFAKKNQGYIDTLRSYLRILIIQLFRFVSPPKDKTDLKTQRIPPEVLSYIKQNYSKNILLNDISDKCFYNPSYFSTLFKETTGLTLSQYIFQTRMDNVIKYLSETTLSINKIASIVGFHNKNHFYKKFRQQTGMTPNEYRQNKKKE